MPVLNDSHAAHYYFSTGTLELHCCKTHAKINRKIENLTRL